jgi:hypothetical protein
MASTTTQPVEIAARSAGNEIRLAAAAEHMHAAETFLHTARQAGIDDWTSIAYQHLHDAVAEHTSCLLEDATNHSTATTIQEILMKQTSDYCADIHASFPGVPARIVTIVFQAYVPVTRTVLEAVQATRERLCDALAA